MWHLVVFYLAKGEAVHLEASLLNVGRIRHLRTLIDMARSYGWRLHGPYPPPDVTESALYQRRQIGAWPVHIYLWPSDDCEIDEGALDRLARFLESGQSLWRGRMVVRSYSGAVLLHRASYMHVKLPAEEIEAILEWLADLVTMMEDSGLAEPEAAPEETESEVVS